MTKKRILIIEDQQQLSGLSPVSDCQLFVTYDPQQALSLLMGGSTLLRSRFAEQKVKPDLLLMHASFFQQESGIEFLELIKKYYSLKSIQVFLFGEPSMAPDADTLARYNIVSFLELPLKMAALLELIEESPERELNFNKKIWAFPGVLLTDHIKPFLQHLAGNKTVLINSGKALVKTKVFYSGVSAVAVASAVSIPLIQEDQTTPIPKEIRVEVKAPVKSPPAAVIDSFPPIKEPVPPPAPKKTKPVEPIIEEQPVIEPAVIVPARRDFKIQIVPDSTDLSSDF